MLDKDRIGENSVNATYTLFNMIILENIVNIRYLLHFVLSSVMILNGWSRSVVLCDTLWQLLVGGIRFYMSSLRSCYYNLMELNYYEKNSLCNDVASP